ncbi:MAG: antibiotic biosynthesis monooxygenase [Acetobacteraceae bacterium]|nr:antibiotic biosynthesis monooxygenase [Acetobacteraceae bacterium]MBV8522404.1 antibiotic biosynthesis monooxygenase [Acetobacteraceae bacterium]MBV8590705.1 antibiotic biosynthesis monooxygenase [Acetobacteraceae bacterium]
MVKLVEMDDAVTIRDQLEDRGAGPVILINKFTVPAADAEAMVRAWTDDAEWMKRQPGFISTQLHRGIRGSSLFLNYAVWESTEHFKAAFSNPEFQARLGRYPASAVASPHLFRKVAVPGLCVA